MPVAFRGLVLEEGEAFLEVGGSDDGSGLVALLECVHVVDGDVVVGEFGHEAGEGSGLVGAYDAEDVGDDCGEAGVFEYGLCFVDVGYDDSEDSEFDHVGSAEGEDVDAGVGECAGDFFGASGAVFEEY